MTKFNHSIWLHQAIKLFCVWGAPPCQKRKEEKQTLKQNSPFSRKVMVIVGGPQICKQEKANLTMDLRHWSDRDIANLLLLPTSDLPSRVLEEWFLLLKFSCHFIWTCLCWGVFWTIQLQLEFIWHMLCSWLTCIDTLTSQLLTSAYLHFQIRPPILTCLSPCCWCYGLQVAPSPKIHGLSAGCLGWQCWGDESLNR